MQNTDTDIKTNTEIKTSPAAHPDPTYAAYIGIDWAKSQHAVALQPAGGGEIDELWLDTAPESVHAWARGLLERFGGAVVAVGVELSKGALIEELRGYGHIDIYPLNPATTSSYRSAFTPSGAKDDMPDACLQLELVRDHRDKIRLLAEKSGTDRKIELLAIARRKLVDTRTGLTNTLRSTLESYYPLALDVCGELGNPMSCNLILKWPEHGAIARARPETLRKFYHAAGSRSESVIDKRLEKIAAAEPVTTERDHLAPMIMLATSLARQIKALNAEIEKFEKEIAAAYATHRDHAIWSSFPGAGETIAPRLACAWGANREAYPGAADMQLYSGIAPVTERSGTSTWIHRRYSRPAFLHQTFWEYAHQSAKHCEWANAYIEVQKARGKKHSTAVRSLAFKWIRIMHACWRTGEEYDDERYTRILQGKGSPLVAQKQKQSEQLRTTQPAEKDVKKCDQSV